VSLDAPALDRLEARYPGKRAAITGAGSGLGRALALALGRRGWTLFLNDSDGDRLARAEADAEAAGASVVSACFDVRDLNAHLAPTGAFLEAHGGIDLVFTCAGIGMGGLFVEADPDHLREVVEVNLLGTMWTAKAFLPSMISAGRGHLVTIASAAAYHGLPKLAAYAATKAGVVQWSETVRSELRPYGIDITVKLTTFYTSNIADYTRGPAEEREKARSLVNMAPWSAEAVADALLLAVQRRQFYMVAPGQARLLWRVKRLLPELYLRIMPDLFSRLERKLMSAQLRVTAHQRCVYQGENIMPASTKPFGEAWITEYFAMVDTLKLDEFLSWYAEDATFTFANSPPAHGKDAIGKALQQFYGLITSMHHEKTGCWTDDNSGAFEAVAHFVTNDGRSIDLPAVSTLRVRDNLVHEFKFVMDASPITQGASK